MKKIYKIKSSLTEKQTDKKSGVTHSIKVQDCTCNESGSIGSVQTGLDPKLNQSI